MIAALVIIIVIVLLAGIAIPSFLRSWGADEARTEQRLHDPSTHTVAYAVPNGIDPAVIKAGLAHAGYTSVTDRVGQAECLIVECAPHERDRVRGVIESVHASPSGGTTLGLTHLGPVVFEDER
jgi:hypothetical protein